MTEPRMPQDQPEYLTVRELAELLRLKERKIYDLAASGQVPCSRATGKLLFPAREIQDWINQAVTGRQEVQSASRPMIVLGSHDPLLDWSIRQSRSGLACYYDGSMDGLRRFARGEGVIAGLHIKNANGSGWNTEAVRELAAEQNAVLIRFAKRRRGLVQAQGGTRTSLSDLRGARIVPRQPGSGTDLLFQRLASDCQLDLDTLTLTDEALTEDEAVDAVRRGVAEVAFGLEVLARSYGLGFVPVIEEEFALLVDRQAWFEAPIQRLIAFINSTTFKEHAADIGGYDVVECGNILWNA